jgi:hypothetical protein
MPGHYTYYKPLSLNWPAQTTCLAKFVLGAFRNIKIAFPSKHSIIPTFFFLPNSSQKSRFGSSSLEKGIEPNQC